MKRTTSLALAAILTLAVPAVSVACPNHNHGGGYYTGGYNYGPQMAPCGNPCATYRPVCQPAPVCRPMCDPCDPCRRSGLLGLGILGIL